MRLRLGTRGSPLALRQAARVGELLQRAHPFLEVELVTVTTRGDRLSLEGVPLFQQPVGAFVREVQGALLRGEVDLAVHSAKDLPLEPVEGLWVAAYPERAHPGDLLISRGPGWEELSPGDRVGTSSVRRRTFLQRARGDLRFVDIRGNVDTRLRKLREGEVEALILAAAGWERLGLSAEHVEDLPFSLLLPAPAQGALAVEVREDREDLRELVGAIDREDVRQAVEMERGLLAFLSGGCWSALGVLAQKEGEGWHLQAAWGEGGGEPVEARGRDPRTLVEEVGRKLLLGAGNL